MKLFRTRRTTPGARSYANLPEPTRTLLARIVDANAKHTSLAEHNADLIAQADALADAYDAFVDDEARFLTAHADYTRHQSGPAASRLIKDLALYDDDRGNNFYVAAARLAARYGITRRTADYVYAERVGARTEPVTSVATLRAVARDGGTRPLPEYFRWEDPEGARQVAALAADLIVVLDTLEVETAALTAALEARLAEVIRYLLLDSPSQDQVSDELRYAVARLGSPAHQELRASTTHCTQALRSGVTAALAASPIT